MSKFGDLIGKSTPPAPEPVVESTPPPAPKRARDDTGHYIADELITIWYVLFSLALLNVISIVNRGE